MLNPPPYWPFQLPEADPDLEPYATGVLNTYQFASIPQRIGDPSCHRFLIPYDIGIWTNGNRGGSMVAGLSIGQFNTYDVDQCPDFWFVSLESETTVATVALRVYLAVGVGGPFFRLGNRGRLKIPAQGQNAITLMNTGTGIAFGTVIAAKGFDPNEFDYSG